MDSIKWRRVRATAGLIYVCYTSLTCCPFPAAGLPNNFSVVQVDGVSLLVSWTEPTTGATPTGYRVYYQAAGDSTFTTVDTGPTATEQLLEGLSAGTTYTIRIVAHSQHLPSSVTDPEMVTIGRYSSGRSHFTSKTVCMHRRGYRKLHCLNISCIWNSQLHVRSMHIRHPCSADMYIHVATILVHVIRHPNDQCLQCKVWEGRGMS